jgi:hypothetical protein
VQDKTKQKKNGGETKNGANGGYGNPTEESKKASQKWISINIQGF